MTTIEFLSHLRTRNIQLSVEGDKLRLNAPRGALTEELRAELTRRKAEILAFLQQAAELRPAGQPPLVPISRAGDLPLSFAQQRLWVLDQLDPESPAYNLPLALRLTGALDKTALQHSLDEIFRRHEGLRTTFAGGNVQPRQIIAPPAPVPITEIDLQALRRAEQEKQVVALAEAEALKPFKLSAGPLLRVTLLRLSEREHVLILVMHHIISDAWSLGVLFRELVTLYEAFASGRPSPLPELRIQYADFAHWQRQWLQGEVLETQAAFWRKQLAGVPVLELPGDFPRPAVQTFNGRRRPFELPHSLTEGLSVLCLEENVTLFMVLLAAFQTLLHRYTGQTDLAVGAPIANRSRVEIEPLIGFFVNTLVYRSDLSGDPTFRELVRRVKEVALNAYSHQDVPFERLVEMLQPERDLSHSPLFQVMFIFQNTPVPATSLAGLQVSPVDFQAGTAKFDLTLTLFDGQERLRGSLEYNSDLFKAETIERMLHHFLTLLRSLAGDPDQRLSELPLLTASERRKLLVEWNATGRAYSRDRCVHELFEAQAATAPDRTAAVFGQQAISYGELNRRANQLAHHLRALGVGPETLVAVCLERSLEMLIALLAVHKAGGAYVPLDPAFPADRLAYMLEDSQAAVLLTQQSLLETLPHQQAAVLCLEAQARAIAGRPADNPGRLATPQNLAYVIYTSGSTGKPKGVQVQQGAVVNFLESMREAPGMHAGDVLLAVTTLSFDIAGLELFLPLLVGGRVVIASRETASDGTALLQLLTESRATIMQATPATWRMLLAAGWQGSPNLKILCGGEAMPAELAQALLPRCAELWNLYGPTETTIWSTLQKVEHVTGGFIAIGRPIANTQIYILDAAYNPTPVGIAGELYIGGEGLARGYLNRPALTAEKFVPHPLATQLGERLYRTGDLARYLPDGTIEFIGRIDHQVKIRGFRIELGEIESVLTRHPQIKQAVVIAREDVPGDKRLVAYLVTDKTAAPGVTELRQWLRQSLPDYMLPAAFVFLESFPLTPNGKVNRRALPRPELSDRGRETEYVAPRDAREEKIAALWRELLAHERIGVFDNFFHLGGHSLLATQLVTRLRQVFGVPVPLRRVFEDPTIAGLAAYLAQHDNGNAVPPAEQIQPIPRSMVPDVDKLSDEEVEALLQQMMAEPTP
ncbi:MAG: amino acid adenylation domain-containing protein [candidate division KSB1 bacterium]|nr:amino acid adenylation domain-containing protein [candidate division KSB1 bacterium]MDZ7275817.1 amino acid adenylation domain-containing protein [candidate division KSB1 bacterium]MDZ7287568.1 amino acid adenylation domain-containing protein [candidate division KSB1 bacterium]MDZ7308028.1 amino acid adenylation domain-containing protein [candidate division KSB1 bacterium]MDZ7350546.1 amino acid adenylation domain-containing protein [candidate division KSB1 bacterium]